MPKSSKSKLAYQKEYNAKPANVAKRVANNAARRELIKDGKVKLHDGKDVAHKRSLENGGTNAKSNLEVQSRTENREPWLAQGVWLLQPRQEVSKAPLTKVRRGQGFDHPGEVAGAFTKRQAQQQTHIGRRGA